MSLEKTLREKCTLIDWNPTAKQLEDIKNDIEKAIRSGKTLSISDCQQIVVTHCGSTRMLSLSGVDNSDLNTLLLMATKPVSK